MMSNITQINQHTPEQDHKIFNNLLSDTLTSIIQMITNKICKTKFIFIRITPIKTLNQCHSYLFFYSHLLLRKILNNLL